MSIDQDYYTINKTAKMIGKSPTTVTRFVRSVVKGEAPDASAIRHFIIPTAIEKQEGSSKPWQLNLALIRRQWPDSFNDGNDAAIENTMTDRMMKVIEQQSTSLSNSLETQRKRNDELTKERDQLKDDLSEANHIIDLQKTKLLEAGIQDAEESSRNAIARHEIDDVHTAPVDQAEKIKKGAALETRKPWWRRLRIPV